MPWKKTLFRRDQKSPEPPREPDPFTKLKAQTPQVRNQGEPPRRDPAAFSRFVCDLCSASRPVTELRQCAVCGRWACSTCWNDEYYLCRSCTGILRLHRIPDEKE